MTHMGEAADGVAADGALATIAALRAQGAHLREPLRLHFAAALARRTATQTGALRQLLDTRLAAALADLQQRLAQPAAAPAVLPRAAPGALARLLRDHGTGGPATAAAPPGELKAVQQFASTWARLRVDQQLQRSQARQPENAGPLNSQRLVLQTLQQLRQLSPDYLQHFMAHADALLWLDHSAAVAAAAAAAPVAPERRRGASRRAPPRA